MSLQLSMVMSDVEAAGMMIMGVLEPVDTLLHVNECNETAREQGYLEAITENNFALHTAYCLQQLGNNETENHS